MIEVEHLSKTYGSTVAIEDVTFRVEPGEILGFLGPNGAGKTTTMRILTGYLPANSGTARIADYDVHTDSMAVRQRIGYLPETPPLYLDMTVADFLAFVARIKGVAAGDRNRRVEWALDRCGIWDKRDILIRKLSKGYRQRVGIAQAIVHDPPAIILDEPTVGLDPRQIIEVRNLIKSLAGDHTIILSTHILPEVNMTCDRVAIINRGRVVATGTLDSLMEKIAGNIRYDLEVAGDSAVAQQTLAAIPQVSQVEVDHDTSLPEGHLRLQVSLAAGDDIGRDLATALVHAGIGLFEMHRSRVSLEDVFLNLTTQEQPLDGSDLDDSDPNDSDTNAAIVQDVENSADSASAASTLSAADTNTAEETQTSATTDASTDAPKER